MAYNYIITSDDKEAAFEKAEEIKKSLGLDFDSSSYDLEDDGIYSVIDELTTVSLFANPKFVIVRSAEYILTCSDKALNELYRAMNDIQSENVLIFMAFKPFDQNHEKYQRLKRYASSIDIRMKNIPIEKYIQQSLEGEGYTIESQALSLLASYQPDLGMLRGILEQLKCYKYEDKRVTDADIKKLVAPPLDDNVYQLVEAVLNHDKKRAFSCFRDLRLRFVQASYLVSLLINKFQELYNVFILVKGNTSQADIANLFNVSSGRAYYMVKNAKATNLNEIKRNLDLLNELDYRIKTGKVEQNLGLELYFLK